MLDLVQFGQLIFKDGHREEIASVTNDHIFESIITTVEGATYKVVRHSPDGPKLYKRIVNSDTKSGTEDVDITDQIFDITFNREIFKI